MSIARWSLSSPPQGVGAIAVFTITGDIELATRRMGMPSVRVGDVRLRDLLGIDRGLVARPASNVLLLTAHGGRGVVRVLAEALTGAGIEQEHAPNPLVHYPEARSEVEARALHALTRARSPLAVDLLLAQHERWSAPGARSDPRADSLLNRLIDPPLVVALGPPNIGKSTLLNALAKRSVAITADEEGTTRDHVGALIDMNGIVVQYVDTPGMRDDADPDVSHSLLDEARRIALRVAAKADLLVLCRDGSHEPIHAPESCSHVPRLLVSLRADLGTPAQPVDVAVSAKTGTGLDALVTRIGEALVPVSVRSSTIPWKFWS